MTELDKLEKYLKKNKYNYERIERTDEIDTHMIIVYENGERVWDAICHEGSFGYEQGLLEIMGTIVQDEEEEVEGYLTAKEIIKRLEIIKKTKKNEINIMGCPKEAWNYEFIVVSNVDGNLIYYNHTTNGFKAEKMASEIPNGLIVHNVRISGYKA